MDIVDGILALAIALVGTSGVVGWRKMSAESDRAKAETGRITDEGGAFLRSQIRELDQELVEQRKRRMDLAAELEVAKQALIDVRHRVEKLEAWILINTTTDPKDINGWRDRP